MGSTWYLEYIGFPVFLGIFGNFIFHWYLPECQTDSLKTGLRFTRDLQKWSENWRWLQPRYQNCEVLSQGRIEELQTFVRYCNSHLSGTQVIWNKVYNLHKFTGNCSIKMRSSDSWKSKRIQSWRNYLERENNTSLKWKGSSFLFFQRNKKPKKQSFLQVNYVPVLKERNNRFEIFIMMITMID